MSALRSDFTWREPLLLGRREAVQEGEEQADQRRHGCCVKPVVFTKLTDPSVLLPPYSISSLPLAESSRIPRYVCIQREQDSRKYSITTSPPLFMGQPLTRAPVLIDRISSWRRAAVAPLQPIKGGQMETGGLWVFPDFPRAQSCRKFLKTEKVYVCHV